MNKVRWGILSTAKIGREKVIPALKRGAFCRVDAIASRDKARGQQLADQLDIPKVYGSYEELLQDPQIDAVYIPLPNHLHVTWTIRSLELGKHVLCEKPIGLSSAEAQQLLNVARQHPNLRVMEAFMYRFHPQWQLARKLVHEGKIGTLQTVQSFFSYSNVDPHNIRNRKDAGGGGLMDIGCYCISFARFLFDREPQRVVALMETNPDTQTDILTSGILDFAPHTSTFTCSTRLMPYQRVNILGTEGRIEIEVPVNAPPDAVTRMVLHTRSGAEEITFEPVDQYTIQGDLFAQSILRQTRVPVSLEDAVCNMKVLDALFESAAIGSWKAL